jgi:signal transduction histidine kinase
MTQPQNPAQDDPGGILQRVHQLGSATESLFSRIYSGLGKRDKLAEAEAALNETRHKARMVATRNKKLRQMLQQRTLEAKRLHAILARISEGIIMQDNEGRIVMMNDAASDLIGSQRNFWKSDLGTLFNERRDLQTIGSELAPLGEAERVQVDNRILSVQLAAIADASDNRMGTLMILRDVTRDELSERMKRSFVTHISHELITPLSPMRMASEILLNSPDDKPPNQRMLEMISRNVDILDRMVQEMLDLSAMTSGDFQVKKDDITLENLLWEVVWSHEDDMQEAGLEIPVMLRERPAINAIQGDEKHLRWALTNLIRNAIQYNLPDGHIMLSAGINRHNDSEIFIQVADTGVGISDDDMRHIFELFYRGEPRTPDGKRLDPRGLGQGLFIARTIATAHGGYLYAESAPGEGSVFTLTLPRHQRPATLPESS